MKISCFTDAFKSRAHVLVFIAAVFTFAGLAPGCGDKLDPWPVPGGGGGGGDGGGSACDPAYTGKVSYCNQIKPIMDNNCTSCHSGGRTANVDLDTYSGVKSNSDRANLRIQAGTMPPSGALSSDLKAQFSTWICDGMPECI